jgi:CDP-diacylglycerol---serine O-phosphatidyltransferase
MNSMLEPSVDSAVSARKRGVYILPNLFTTAGLFAGFYAIVQAMNGRFELAAVAIFVAMITDKLDGLVARVTHTQSAFGVQFDSLSDMVAFGVAPALVMYVWALKGMGKLGWIAAFIYCAGAALRLAHFNTQFEVADKRYFQGLPSPSAAALVAGLVWVVIEYEQEYAFVGWARNRWFAWAWTVFAGVTMVSFFLRFYSFKEIHFRKSVPFVMLPLMVAVFLLVTYEPPLVLFGFFILYAFSGYVMWAWQARSAKRTELKLAPEKVREEP